LLGEFYVALDCVGRVGGIGFVVLLVSRADFCVVVGLSSFGSL
jgi:hypothetical protein